MMRCAGTGNAGRENDIPILNPSCDAREKECRAVGQGAGEIGCVDCWIWLALHRNPLPVN